MTTEKQEALLTDVVTPEDAQAGGNQATNRYKPLQTATNSDAERAGGELLPCTLHELFVYDPDSGILRHKAKPRVYAGQVVGSKDSKGRLRTEISGESYAVHHICWALHYGEWPKHQIDHINQNKADNRICNLRQATNAENSRNRKSKNEVAKGVSFHKGRYIARIMVNGKVINLGSYARADFAAHAYQVAAKKYHGEFACPTN